MDTEAMDTVDMDMAMVSPMDVPMEDMAMDMDTEAMVMENDEKYGSFIFLKYVV